MSEKTTSRVRPAAFLLLAAACFLAGLPAARGSGESGKVTAHIDSECRSHPGTFKVPEGLHAAGFSKKGPTTGKSCHEEEGAPENSGFAIRDQKGRPVYLWSRYKDDEPYEKGGPLGSLRLGPGDYTLSVAGGAGARIELSYVLE